MNGHAQTHIRPEAQLSGTEKVTEVDGWDSHLFDEKLFFKLNSYDMSL